MKTIAGLVMIWVSIVLCCCHGTARAGEPSLDFSLPVPVENVQRQYLGVENRENFLLGDISADIVIIEVFSMYCPVCQREAANVNTLFSLIQKRSSPEKTIKLIGMGAGNSDFEVEFFRKKYAIAFPLFSDADFSIHKKIGAVRTPHFFGLTLTGTGTFTVFYSGNGDLSDPGKFLDMFLSEAEGT